MKEFYLVPTHEMDEIQNKTTIPKTSDNPYNDENKLFNNDKISRETILEIKQQMDRLRSEINSKTIAKTEEKRKKVPHQIKENSKLPQYMKLIFGNVPNGFEISAMNTISDLEKNGVIVVNDDGYVSLYDGRDEIKLKDFIRAVFVRDAKVSHIKGFLGEVVSFIDEKNIRNNKLIELSKLSKSMKEENDRQNDLSQSDEEFHESVLDVQGGRKPKFVEWIVY